MAPRLYKLLVKNALNIRNQYITKTKIHEKKPL